MPLENDLLLITAGAGKLQGIGEKMRGLVDVRRGEGRAGFSGICSWRLNCEFEKYFLRIFLCVEQKNAGLNYCSGLLLGFSRNNRIDSLFIKVIAGEAEYMHLQGHRQQICMFSTQTINQPTSIIKTGARHSYAKWLLVPAKLRVQFNTDKYSYNDIRAGFVEYKDCVFIIYKVNRKGMAE